MVHKYIYKCAQRSFLDLVRLKQCRCTRRAAPCDVLYSKRTHPHLYIRAHHHHPHLPRIEHYMYIKHPRASAETRDACIEFIFYRNDEHQRSSKRGSKFSAARCPLELRMYENIIVTGARALARGCVQYMRGGCCCCMHDIWFI